MLELKRRIINLQASHNLLKNIRELLNVVQEIKGEPMLSLMNVSAIIQ